MLVVAHKLLDKGVSNWLNAILKAGDALANNIIYHNLCWANAKKKACPKSEQEKNISTLGLKQN